MPPSLALGGVGNEARGIAVRARELGYTNNVPGFEIKGKFRKACNDIIHHPPCSVAQAHKLLKKAIAIFKKIQEYG
jgi:hypothetical protein